MSVPGTLREKAPIAGLGLGQSTGAMQPFRFADRSVEGFAHLAEPVSHQRRQSAR